MDFRSVGQRAGDDIVRVGGSSLSVVVLYTYIDWTGQTRRFGHSVSLRLVFDVLPSPFVTTAPPCRTVPRPRPEPLILVLTKPVEGTRDVTLAGQMDVCWDLICLAHPLHR